MSHSSASFESYVFERNHPNLNCTFPVNKSDEELINECLAGQTEAFSQIVGRYQNRLYNTLVSVLGSADDARDASQEAWVLAFQKLDSFRGHSAFYSWLFRIALNSAVSHQRKSARVRLSTDQVAEQTGAEPPDSRPDTSPSHSLEVQEKQEAVQRALNELAEEYRVVLVLKEFEGLKYEEIAEIVDCPIGTVRSRIHRARMELREKLEGILGRD